jgi:glyoxylase-like metal-dependent hydrolase (beta-lactamase superfamily II)
MSGTAAGQVRFPFAAPPQEGEAVEVADGVIWLRLPLPMALNHVNVYALDDGDGWAIIDTGMDTVRARTLWEAILAGPLRGRPVTRIIVTHHHPDHVGLAAWLMRHGARLEMPRTGWLMARMLTLDVQPSYAEGALAFYKKAGVDQATLDRRGKERPFNFADCVALLPPGYHRLREGDVVRIGGRDWDIRMGHGHAPEHATFWSRDDDLVIGGDQLLPSISANLGVYANEPDADPVADWLESCARLMPFADENHLVLPGHKMPYAGLPGRLSQMIEGHHAALDRLSVALKQPLKATETFSALYQRNISEAEFGLALAEALGHLNHLEQSGLARRWIAEDGAYLWQGL